ncbi:MAG: hypothetical protein ACPG4B_08820 [Cycloclasticus sp.]
MSIRKLTNEEVDSLFPIRNFSDNSKQQLQEMVETTRFDANSILFSAGDTDEHQIYGTSDQLRTRPMFCL